MPDLVVDPVLEHALWYARLGWRVVPIVPREKRPALNAWQDKATTDADLIGRWWNGPGRGHGVGIVTGERSGLWVLDVDPLHGGDDTLADLEHEHGRLPDTIRSVTGSGGAHILFRWPGLNPGTGAGRLGPGLDIRAEGGQIVAPPTLHPNGNVYAWEDRYGPDEMALADAPKWLLDLLKPTEAKPREHASTYQGAPRPGDRWAAQVAWADLLTGDGAVFLGERTERVTGERYELWARPGLPADDLHTSATLYYKGSDVLKVHSSNWPSLNQDETYTKLGYLAATRHGGDFTAAAKWCEQQVGWGLSAPVAAVQVPVTEDEGSEEPADAPLIGGLVDWPTFWRHERDDDDWLVRPLLARGRSHALYAPAKTGKSLLALEVAAAAASGRPVLDQEQCEPFTVLYLDLEMTEDDLYGRLSEMGYGADVDLSRLHYHLLPVLPPLDSADGGALVLAEAQRVGADLVVIDTVSRSIAGDENESTTIIDLARHTFTQLKRAGITSLRVDHAGKDLARGQRGTSAKNDDVDVVWRLTVADGGGFVLRATHRRLGWIPEEINLTRSEAPLCHRLVDGTWPAGTAAVARDLDELGAPIDIGKRAAAALLQGADRGARSTTIQAALRLRREQAQRLSGGSGDSGPTEEKGLGTHGADTSGSRPSDLREPTPDPSGPVGHGSWDPESPPKGDSGAKPTDATEIEGWF